MFLILVECKYCGKISDTKQSFDKHREAVEGAEMYFCPVCRTKYTANRYIRRHENSINHRLLSLAQYVPHHPEMTDDNLIGQFKCPLHNDEDPHYFVTKENCAEHIKTHGEKELHEPVDRLGGKSCKNLGVFTCKYCKFKTNSEEYAKFHIRGVHEDHLDKPAEIKDNDKYEWESDLGQHFKICGKNEQFSKGKYSCGLCGKTYPSTGDTKSHLLGPFHEKDYENALIGIIPNDKKLLTIEIATEAIKLMNKYKRARVYTQVKKNRDDTSFLKVLILISDENTKNWFWRIPNSNGEYKNDKNCYPNKFGSFNHIARINKNELLRDFLKNDQYSSELKLEYIEWIQNDMDNEVLNQIENIHDRTLTPNMNFEKAEISWISNRKSFQNFVINVRKYKLIHTSEAHEKSIPIPKDCQQIENENTNPTAKSTETPDEQTTETTIEITDTTSEKPTYQDVYEIFKKPNNKPSNNKPAKKPAKKPNKKINTSNGQQFLDTWLLLKSTSVTPTND